MNDRPVIVKTWITIIIILYILKWQHDDLDKDTFINAQT